VHVLAFSSKRELLLCESEGRFDMQLWEPVVDLAEVYCCRAEGDQSHGQQGGDDDEDEKMDDHDNAEDGDDGKGQRNMQNLLESVVSDAVEKRRAWKEFG